MGQELDLTLNIIPEINAKKINVILKQLKSSLGTLGKDIKFVDGNKLAKELAAVDKSAKATAKSFVQFGNAAGAAAKQGSTLQKAFQFNQIAQSIQFATNALKEFAAPLQSFEQGLAELQAITGVTDETLQKLGASGRQLALEFGGEITSQLDAFTGILSRFGPALAQAPDELASVANSVNLLAKAGGIDAAQAMDALTNSMLQFGLYDDTDFANTADNAADATNVLAAASKVGAADIPKVAEAIVVTGTVAKSANLSLEETTAAIETLASAAGVYGSQAGTGLRNIIGLLQKNSKVAEDLTESMGLPFEKLGETLTKEGLANTLDLLGSTIDKLGTDAQKNAAIMRIFGRENAAYAQGLINNTDTLRSFTDQITNTNVAVEQTAIVMDTAQGRSDRLAASIEDKLITAFEALGTGALDAINAFTQLTPLLLGIGAVGSIIPTGTGEKISKFAGNIATKMVPALGTAEKGVSKTRKAMQLLNAAMKANPWAFAIGGAIALGVALAALGVFSKQTAANRLEEAEAESDLIDKKFQLIDIQEKQKKSTLELTDEYERLIDKQFLNAKESEHLRDITIKLSKALPDVILSTNDYVGNMEKLREKAVETHEELEKLIKQTDELRELKLEVEITITRLNFDVAIDTLAETLDDNNFWSKQADFLAKNYSDSLNKAADSSEVDTALIKFIGKLKQTTEFQEADNIERKKILEAATATAQARLKAIEDINTKEVESYQKQTKAIVKAVEERERLKQAALEGEGGEQIEKLIESQQAKIDDFTADILAKTQEINNAVAAGEFDLAGKLFKEVNKLTDGLEKAGEKTVELRENVVRTLEVGIQEGIVESGEAAIQKNSENVQELMDQYDATTTSMKTHLGALKLLEAGVPDALIKKTGKYFRDPKLGIGEFLEADIEGLQNWVDAQKNATGQGKELMEDFVEGAKDELQTANFGEVLSNALDIKDKIDNTEALVQLKKDFDAAETLVAKANIAEKIEKAVPDAVKVVGEQFDATARGMVNIYEIANEELDGHIAKQTELSSDELVNATKKVNEQIEKQGDLFADNTKKAAQYKKDLDNTDETDANFKALEKLFQQADAAAGKSQDNIVESLAEAQKAGINTSQAIKNISDETGISEENIQKMVDNQKDFKDETEESEKAVISLGEAFKNALSLQKAQLASIRSELAGVLVDTTKTDAEKQLAISILVTQYKVLEAAAKKNSDAQIQAGKLLGISDKKKSKSQQDFLGQKLEEYNTFKDILEETNKQLAFDEEKLRIKNDITKTAANEFIEHERTKKALQEQKKSLIDIFEISAAGEPILKGLKDDDVKKVKDLLKDLESELQDEEITGLTIEADLRLEKKNVDEELARIAREQLILNIQLGIVAPEGLQKDLKNELDSIVNQIIAAQNVINELELEKKVDPGQFTAEDEAALIIAKQKYIDLQNEEIVKKDDILLLNDIIYQAVLANIKAEEDALNEKHEGEINNLNRRLDIEKRISTIVSDAATKSGTDIAEKENEEKLKNLQAQKDEEIITEEEFDKKKEDLEIEHQANLQVIREIARGRQLEEERQHQIALLELAKAQAEEQQGIDQKALEQRKKDGEITQEQFDKLIIESAKPVNDLAKQISEKKDLLIAYSGEMQEGITEIFTGLFSGDEDALKEPWRKILAIAVGGLEKYLSAVIAKLVLAEVSNKGPLGIAALLIIPAATALISSALNAFAQPFFNDILSFSTSGVIDSPTMAVVGDAKKGGSKSNREYIMWEEHIYRIMDETMARSMGMMKMLMQTEGQTKNILATMMLTGQMGRLTDALNNLRPLFEKQAFTADNILKFGSTYAKQRALDQDYFTGNLSTAEYNHRNMDYRIKVKALASGAVGIDEPTLTVIGEAGSENVLTDQQLQDFAINNQSFGTDAILRKLSDIETAVWANKDTYLDLEKVTSEVNRENNRNR